MTKTGYFDKKWGVHFERKSDDIYSSFRINECYK